MISTMIIWMPVKKKGFTIDADQESGLYTAYNPDGYCLDMSHIGENLSIEVDEPMELGPVTWPTGSAGSQLPVPKSTTGRFSYENDDSFYVYIGDTSKKNYKKYVTACSDKGFHVDYNKGKNYYRAYNADGWYVSLQYEGNSIMSIKINAPDEDNNTGETEAEKTTDSKETVKPEEPIAAKGAAEPVEAVVTEETAAFGESAEAGGTAESGAPPAAEGTAAFGESAEADGTVNSGETTAAEGDVNSEETVEGLRPDFKKAMDSYEEFMDKYVAFMENYDSDTTDLTLLADYAEFMGEYADFAASFEDWESEDLNTEELQYYIEVQSRVSQKLLEIADE